MFTHVIHVPVMLKQTCGSCSFGQVQMRAAVSYSWREKGRSGQCFPTCHPSLLCPAWLCVHWQLPAELRGSPSFCQSLLSHPAADSKPVMTWNQDGPVVITGGSPYCQGDFHSRLWFPLWYYWGSQLPVLISTGCTQLWRCKMTGMRICDISSAVCVFSCFCLTHCITVLLVHILNDVKCVHCKNKIW